jgi:thiol:disulfide interchange protein DsbD
MWPRYGGLRTVVKEGWDPFSLAGLQQVAVEQGRTVLVDFSAEWCPNCKVLEAIELHTTPVEQAVAETGAVRMYADFTDRPKEIEDTLKHLKSNGVPVIAIFPGDRPYYPIVFRGGYTKSDVIEALNRSRSRAAAVHKANAFADVAAPRQ